MKKVRGELSLLALMALTLVAGCATRLPPSLQIDASTTAVSQDSRVQHLILHFTTVNNELSLKILSQGPVSSHYLVTERVGATPPKILQLVDENRRAYHAGVSYWKGAAGINASSIGIEIVNLGGRKGPYSLEFQSFDDEQIALVIELCKDIIKRHGIRPERVLGHSDIAPTRKNDPGPKFPWKRFADAGLILWPDAASVAQKRTLYDAKLPDVKWFQEKLKAHGFDAPQHGDLDRATRDMLTAFQMKYRPENYDGQPDAETAALVDVLVAQAAARK